MSEQLHHSPFAWNDAITIFIFAGVEGVCDTPLQFLANYFPYWGSSFTPCERSLPRIERTGVGAYRIRPSRERTTPSSPFAKNYTLTIFIFAAMEGVCDTPLQFLAEDFLFADYMIFLSSTASVEAKLLINVFICLFAYSKLPVQFDNVKIYF